MTEFGEVPENVLKYQVLPKKLLNTKHQVLLKKVLKDK